MKWILIPQFMLVLFCIALARLGMAATSCSISAAPTEFSAIYSSTGNARSNATVTVTCQTTSGTQNVSFTLTPDDGLHPSGSQNIASFGSSSVNYDLYSNNGCNNLWTGLSKTINATATGVSTSDTIYHCAKPTTPAPAAGYHTDFVTLTLAVQNPGVTITGGDRWGYPVNIGVPISCQISSQPGNINFGTYTAFSSTALSSNTSFKVRCTQANQAITIDTGTPGGVVPNTGLNYSLAIGTTTSGGSNPLNYNMSNTGGTEQTFYINGTIPAGQAGQCSSASCTGSEQRTLTITYN